MKDPQREKFVAEIRKYETAIKNTASPFLKKDYRKKIRQMRFELAEYDRYHKNGCRRDS